MTVISSIKGIISNENSNNSLFQKGFNFISGVSQNGTSHSITLSAESSSINDFYINKVIEIVSGIGVKHQGFITGYNGQTKVATISNRFDVVPNKSEYIIHLHSGKCDIQDQENIFKTVKINSSASNKNGIYNECFIKFYNNNLDTSTIKIINYDGDKRIVTLSREIDIMITQNTLYQIFGEGGIVESSTPSTLVLQQDHDHKEIDDFYNGLNIEIYSGTGLGQTRVITGYIGSTKMITVNKWDIQPDSTSKYVIYGGWVGKFSECKLYSQITNTLIKKESEFAIIDQQFSLDKNGYHIRENNIPNVSNEKSATNTIVTLSEYFRVRIIGLGTSITGSLQTTFHPSKSKGLTYTLNEPITENTECDIIRSVICGRTNNNKYTNIKVLPEGNVLTNLINPTTSFGDIQTAELTPVEQISFTYNTDSVITDVNSGTIINMITHGTDTSPQIQSIRFPNGKQFNNSGVGNYFVIYATNNNRFYVWFNVEFGNTDPAVNGTGIEVNINSSDTPSQVANKVKTIMNSDGNFTVSIALENIIIITNKNVGKVKSLNRGTMPTTTSSKIVHESENSMINLINGLGIGMYSSARSKRALVYRPGQGAVGRFSAIFSKGIDGGSQLAGIGNQVSGFFFGYNGSDFGIMHRQTGQPEIRVLEITNGPVTNGILTVTLDGIDFDVPVTNQSGNLNSTASEIANYNYKMGEWLTEAIGNKVYFLGATVPLSGRDKEYSLGGELGITGTFTTISSQRLIVNKWTKQSD